MSEQDREEILRLIDVIRVWTGELDRQKEIAEEEINEALNRLEELAR